VRTLFRLLDAIVERAPTKALGDTEDYPKSWH
jgi:hypothetical protein